MWGLRAETTGCGQDLPVPQVADRQHALSADGQAAGRRPRGEEMSSPLRSPRSRMSGDVPATGGNRVGLVARPKNLFSSSLPKGRCADPGTGLILGVHEATPAGTTSVDAP